MAELFTYSLQLYARREEKIFVSNRLRLFLALNNNVIYFLGFHIELTIGIVRQLSIALVVDFEARASSEP
jgi:hypothetical protein